MKRYFSLFDVRILMVVAAVLGILIGINYSELDRQDEPVTVIIGTSDWELARWDPNCDTAYSDTCGAFWTDIKRVRTNDRFLNDMIDAFPSLADSLLKYGMEHVDSIKLTVTNYEPGR